MASKNGRSSASVSLTIGLMSIPVKLYTSSKEDRVSFKMMSPDGNPVKQKLVDAITEAEVSRTEVDKGYPDGDTFVIFTKDEVDALDSHKSNVVDVQEFVPLSTIDSLEIEKTFHINPDTKSRADKAYRALNIILTKKKRAGVAKWYTRGRENLVVIAPRGEGLIMHQMFYATEVKDFELECAKVQVTDAELDLFGQLIDSQTVSKYGDIDERPGLYTDCYVDRVRDAVNAKKTGGSVKKSTDKTTPIGGDLLSVLQASVNAKPKAAAKGNKKKAS